MIKLDTHYRVQTDTDGQTTGLVPCAWWRNIRAEANHPSNVLLSVDRIQLLVREWGGEYHPALWDHVVFENEEDATAFLLRWS